MKTFLLIFISLFLIQIAYGQRRIKKTKKMGDLKEVYYINNETKLQDGFYTKRNYKTKVNAVSGEYVNGLRYGNWVFNDPATGEKHIEFNFSENTLGYINSKQLADSFLVRQDNKYNYRDVERPLVFIGYPNEIQDIIQSQIKIPLSVKDVASSGSTIIQYFVDENGLISGSNSIESFNSIYEKEIDQLVHSLSGRFLPAIVDGENTPSLFYIDITISPRNKNNELQKKEAPYICAIEIYYTPSMHPNDKLVPYINIANSVEEEKASE